MTRVTIRSPNVSGRMALSSASVKPMGSSSSGSSSMSHGTAIPGLYSSDLYSGKKKPPSGAPTGCEPANAPMGAFRSLDSAATFEGLCGPRTGMRNRRILSVGLPLLTSILTNTTPNHNLGSRFIWISLRQPRGSARALNQTRVCFIHAHRHRNPRT